MAGWAGLFASATGEESWLGWTNHERIGGWTASG